MFGLMYVCVHSGSMQRIPISSQFLSVPLVDWQQGSNKMKEGGRKN